MTAVGLKPLTSTEVDAWFSTFTSYNSEVTSCLFMKKLTATCVSTVLHLRNIFPDVCFESQTYEGLSLKILKERNKPSSIRKIHQWLEGAFEAIDKKFLKHLMLDIQDAETNKTLEIYTMSFNYKQGNESLNFLLSTDKTKKHCGFTESNKKLNVINLLNMCSAVIRNSDDLPLKVILAVRLSYNESTPEDYQPKGYMAWSPQNYDFLKQTRSIEIGVAETSHHYFKFINKSCLNERFFKNMESVRKTSDSYQTQEETYNTQVSLILLEASTCFDLSQSKKKLSQSSPNIHTTYVRTPKKPSATVNTARSLRSVFRNKKVRCACLSTEKSISVIPCLACNYLVHAECFGILELQPQKKIKFCCHLCHQSETAYECHDKSLITIKTPADQQKLAVLRKILKFCTKNYVMKITLKQMKKAAGMACQYKTVEMILTLMIETKIVIPQIKKKTYLLDKIELNNTLGQYFYCPENLEYTNA